MDDMSVHCGAGSASAPRLEKPQVPPLSAEPVCVGHRPTEPGRASAGAASAFGPESPAGEGSCTVLSCAPPRLHSALVAGTVDGASVLGFHAAFVRTSAELVAWVRATQRDGGGVIEARRGFDGGHPLLSTALVDILSSAAAGRPEDGVRLSIMLNRGASRVTGHDDVHDADDRAGR